MHSDIIGAYEVELYRQEAALNKCVDEFNRNKCEDPVEALFSYCEEREICINTPISAKLKTVVSISGLMAEVLNGFSCKLTYDSLALTALVLFLIVVGGQFFKNNKPTKIELTLNGN